MKKMLLGFSQVGAGQLHSLYKTVGWGGRVLQFPLVRILLALLFIIPPVLLQNMLIVNFLEKINQPLSTWLIDGLQILVIVALLLCYRFYARLIENRPAAELSWPKGARECSCGFLISLLLVAIMVGLLALPGFFHIRGFNSWPVLAHSIIIFGTGALVQELFFRLILFRIMEEFLGSWIAMAAIAAIFGLAHFFNPNASIWTSAALVLMDVVLSASFMLTRRIWLLWSFHAGWNFFQSGVFGMSNSGVHFSSWIVPTITGPDWLSGGSFGIEASWVAILLNVMAGIYFLKLAHARGQFQQPCWKKDEPGRRRIAANFYTQPLS